MMRVLYILLMALSVSACEPQEPKPIADYFQGRSACFLVYHLNSNTLPIEYNKQRCAQQISPNETFQIPLSLMAFDQQLISQDMHFKWDGVSTGLVSWDHNQTPQEWLSNSVGWVSEQITAQLGIEKIQAYLKTFDYGNQDFSGDAGKNNALKQAWLSSSLKISGYEQLEFLKKLVNNDLSLSPASMFETKDNMYLARSDMGWRLYGKIGSGIDSDFPNQPGFEDGWFVGFVQKDQQVFIVVLNYSDHEQPKELARAGVIAKNITQAILKNRAEFYFKKRQ